MPPISEDDALSIRQAFCLGAISTFIRVKGVSPTLQEISETVGVLKASGQTLVEALTRKGYLQREPGKFRTIRPTPKALSIPARAACAQDE